MKDALSQELIGAHMKVLESKNKSNIGIKGIVRDETKYTISVETENGMKKLLKNESTFEFQIGKNKMIIKGSLLQHRPEERVKLKAKK